MSRLYEEAFLPSIAAENLSLTARLRVVAFAWLCR